MPPAGLSTYVGDDQAAHLSDESRSSSSLSSPQSSPSSKPQFHDTIQVLPRTSFGGSNSASATPQLASAQLPTAAYSSLTAGTPASAGKTQAAKAGDVAPKTRRPRKPRESKDGKPASAAEPKEKKPRKPREPKIKPDPGAAPAASSRKKARTSAVDDKSSVATPEAASLGPRQSTITEIMHNYQPQPQILRQTTPPAPLPARAPSLQPTLSQSSVMSAPLSQHQQQVQHNYPAQHQMLQRQPGTQYVHSSNEHPMRNSLPPQLVNPPTSRPASSGQRYDPVRGATMDAAPPPRQLPSSNGPHSMQSSPQIAYTKSSASTSPAIGSLVSSVYESRPTAPTVVYAPPPTSSQQSQISHLLSDPSPRDPIPVVAVQPPAYSAQDAVAKPLVVEQSVAATLDGAMDIDPPARSAASAVSEVKPARKSSTSSAAPTPKPNKPVQSNIKGTGSGLLSGSSLFGGSSAANGNTERRGVDIDIKIDLLSTNNNINIAQLIAKQYGREAINPRAAAHRQRLLEVAAAANQLEPGLADDMSLDLDSDQDGDNSNIEMGGMTDPPTAAEAPTRKRRRRKAEEYDVDDDFIDDTELAWEQHAKMSSDGFFVYAGPLVSTTVTPGEAGATTTSGRGSGRGRGRGSRGGRTAGSASKDHAALAAERERAANGTTPAGSSSNGAPTTGRGRGGRGRGRGDPNAPRKPRTTKAEKEKAAAAAAAAAAAPTSQPSLSNGAPAASTPSMTVPEQKSAQQQQIHLDAHRPEGLAMPHSAHVLQGQALPS